MKDINPGCLARVVHSMNARNIGKLVTVTEIVGSRVLVRVDVGFMAFPIPYDGREKVVDNGTMVTIYPPLHASTGSGTSNKCFSHWLQRLDDFDLSEKKTRKRKAKV